MTWEEQVMAYNFFLWAEHRWQEIQKERNKANETETTTN